MILMKLLKLKIVILNKMPLDRCLDEAAIEARKINCVCPNFCVPVQFVVAVFSATDQIFKKEVGKEQSSVF